MKVLNLRCEQDHRFEGWFASDDDFQSQNDGHLIECPLCGGKDVTRLPSAPRLNVANLRETPAPAAADSAGQLHVQSKWLRAVRHMLAHTEDVGERFPEEARRIHYGEVAERGIRGQATRDEADALRDEGIEVMAVPVPAGLGGTVQ
jgi:hypothetical protein